MSNEKEKEKGEKKYNHRKTKTLRTKRQWRHWRHLTGCDKILSQPVSWRGAFSNSFKLRKQKGFQSPYNYTLEHLLQESRELNIENADLLGEK